MRHETSCYVLYVLVIIRLERRNLVWINVTPNPSAEWVARQITEAFPWTEAPRYVIRDRDQVYGVAVRHRLRAMGNHLVVLGEAHLRRILTKYAAYYNELRTRLWRCRHAPIAHHGHP
jgi:hypothetical protein